MVFEQSSVVAPSAVGWDYIFGNAVGIDLERMFVGDSSNSRWNIGLYDPVYEDRTLSVILCALKRVGSTVQHRQENSMYENLRL